jgi:hypothetical protein
VSNKRKRRLRALATKLNISYEAADNILRKGRDPIVQEWRRFKKLRPFSLGEKLVMLAIKAPPYNGAATLSDDGLVTRVNELERYLLDKGELDPSEVARAHDHERRLDVQPFVEELRQGLLDRDVQDPPTKAAAFALADEVLLRAWKIINREFSEDFFWDKLLNVVQFLFLTLFGPERIPGEEMIIESIHQGLCHWLFKHRDELLTPSEVTEFMAARMQASP